MSYRCLDCGNASSTRFPGGCCPACDSFNVRSRAGSGPRSEVPERQTKPKASKEKKVMLVVFWALFLFGLWDNYLKDWLAA